MCLTSFVHSVLYNKAVLNVEGFYFLIRKFIANISMKQNYSRKFSVRESVVACKIKSGRNKFQVYCKAASNMRMT